jgi:hypothetical protein
VKFRINKNERDKLKLNQNQKDILIGLLLGDLYIQILNNTKNPKLRFIQRINNSNYLLHLYDLFEIYCKIEPKIRSNFDKRTSKIYKGIYFNNLSLPCFNEFHLLFYNSEDEKIYSIKHW